MLEDYIKSSVDNCKMFVDILDLFTNGVCITDPDGKILLVNRAFCEACQYQKDELVGQNPRILKSEVHNQEFYKNMWDCIKSGNTWSGTIINQNKHGDFYTDRVIIAPIQQDGEIICFVCTRHNIDDATDEMLKKLENISAKIQASFVKDYE